MMLKFDNTYTGLPEQFFARVKPARVPEPELIKFNRELAIRLGAKANAYSDNGLARIFSGQDLLPGSDPIALAYAGHQFGHFVPRLGDGRALLLGEVITPSGERFDLQMKGSGQTPFSRGGDGKAPLGPVLREYLVSEGMHHLGLPATRALAAVATGENVYREKAQPGAIITRAASSHVRVGTFEYFEARQDLENLKKLTDYCIKRHFPEIRHKSDSYLLFFQEVARAQVELVTGWMAMGFIHGVMNTDNMSIAGETIDFGPCAFMDSFRFNQVFSSIDQFGRYSYSNQARITLWNLSRLANSLVPLVKNGSGRAAEEFQSELSAAGTFFEERLHQKMGQKLGLFNTRAQDWKLITKWLQHLESHGLDYTLSFRVLSNLVDNEDVKALFDDTPNLRDFLREWRKRVHEQDMDIQTIKERMDKANPVFIPRNHRIEQVIAAGLQGDFSLFHEMNEVLKKPFEDRKEFEAYKTPPAPHEAVQATFCGT